MFQFLRTKNAHSASLLLLLLLGADFIFIMIHIICKVIIISASSLYSIDQDRGYPEIYQYIKFFWIIIMLLYILISTKCINYISWILVFIYFLCDDAFRIHERVGFYIAKSFNFNPPLHLRLQDFGELSVSVIMGALLSSIIVIAYRGGAQIFKKITNDMILFIIALVFFGVFFDMLNIAINLGWVMRGVMGIIEDGGEMIIASLILWYVFQLALCKGEPDLLLHYLLCKSLTKRYTQPAK